MAASRYLIFFILPIIFVLHLLAPAIAEDTENGICTPPADYCWSCASTSNTSNYKRNLNTLLSSFSSINQTNYGFYNSSLGQNPDKVNAIALCRGDLAPNECHSCFNESTHILFQNCTNKKTAIIWAERCTVRYSNISIFGIEEHKPAMFLQSPHKALNAEQFKLVLNPLLANLSKTAATGDSVKKYAAGHAVVPAGSETNQTIYALVQCTPDLDKQNCTDCLEEAASDIQTCCDGLAGGRVLKPSCNLRFESNRFYESAADSPVDVNLPVTTGNNTNNTNNPSNITTKVSPSSFFQLLLSLYFLLSAFALF